MTCTHPNYDDYFNNCPDCGAKGLLPDGADIESLTAQLKTWTAEQGLPYQSADELLVMRDGSDQSILTEHQRLWLEYFITCWEDAEAVS